MELHRILNVLREYRLTFLGVSLLAFVAAVLIPSTLEAESVPIYRSGSTILITPPSSSVQNYGGAAAAAGSDVNRTWFADEVILNQLITSEQLLTRVLVASERNMKWSDFREMVEVTPLSGDHRGLKLVEVAVIDADPISSQKLTRLLTDQFRSYVQELSAQEFANTRKFIEDLVSEAEQRRLRTEESLLLLRENYLGLPTDEEISTRQQSLEGQYQELQREIATAQGEVDAIRRYRSGATNTPPWAVMNLPESSVRVLESNVTEAELALAKEREVYTDENEHVKMAKERLSKAKSMYHRALNENIESLYNDKSAHLQQLMSRSTSLSTQLNGLIRSRMTPEDRRKVKQLERELSLWEENHLSLLQQLYQARVVEQSSKRQGSINVLEQPQLGVVVEDSKLAAGRAKRLALAVPFCLILGAGAAFLRDYLNSSFRVRPRVEEALELPVIAVIPATPSDLTVDWERFKRPLPDSVEEFFPSKARRNGTPVE